MSLEWDEGPVYYREIQKNAYLRRITDEGNSSKLRPLGHKKPSLKPMWTLFCVHNGRTPFLEQYPGPESAVAHKPAWRACLRETRHVTGSVKPHVAQQYDFLVDTHQGPVRMLAPDWDSMQDWVRTLRNKLQELKILSAGENVYCAPPAPPTPRAPARDPTSPLPPVPHPIPHRVPGIELNTQITRPAIATETSNHRNESSNHRVEANNHVAEASNHGEASNHRTEVSNHRAEASSHRAEGSNHRAEASNHRVEASNHRLESSRYCDGARPEINETKNFETSHEENNISDQESIDISNWDSPFSSLPSTSQSNDPKKKSVAKICGQNICLDDSILKRSVDEESDTDDEFSATDRQENKIDVVNGDIEKLDLDVTVNNSVYKQTVVVNNLSGSHGTSVNTNGDYQGTNVTVIQVSNKEPPHSAIPIVGSETSSIFNFDFKQNVSVNINKEQSFVNIVNTESVTNKDNHNGYGTVFSGESPYGHLSLTTTVSLPGNNTNEGLYEKLCMASTCNESTNNTVTNESKPVKNAQANETSIANSNETSIHANETSRTNAMGTTRVTANETSRINAKDTSRINAIETLRNNANETSRKSSLPNIETNNDCTYECLFPSHIPRNYEVNVSNNQENLSHNITPNTFRSNIVNMASTVIVPPRELGPHTRVLRSNIERSHSQNAYDSSTRTREPLIRRSHNSPKRDSKSDKAEASKPESKPIWRRGLTDLSLLTRLRGIAQNKRQDATAQGNDTSDRVMTSPVKVVHRSRPEARVDSARRRSSSLSNGQSPGRPNVGLQTLRQSQAAALRAEQMRGAAIPATVPVRDPPVFCEYNKQLWVARWGGWSGRWCGRAGDRVAALRTHTPRDLPHVRAILANHRAPMVDILFHRVPLAKMYVVNRKENEALGIKLDGECNIVSIAPNSPAGRGGLVSTTQGGLWALTEINGRSLNLLKGGDEEMQRLSMHGTEVSLLVQPSALVKKIRAALKSNKSILSNR